MTDHNPNTVSELFPSKWINVDDLNGRTFDLTIARIEFDEFPAHPHTKDKIKKAIVWFEKAKKGLILNATQATQIADVAGTERFSEWAGVRITLASGTAPNGKPTITIRPAQAAHSPAPAEEEDPPAQTAVAEKPHVEENGIFDMVYANGAPVDEVHHAAFTQYRRSHSERPAPSFYELVDWISKN